MAGLEELLPLPAVVAVVVVLVATLVVTTVIAVRAPRHRWLAVWLPAMVASTVILSVSAAALLTTDDVPVRPIELGSGRGEVGVPPLHEVSATPTIDVVLGEWDLTTSATEVAPGEVTFRVRNAGELTHTLRIRSDDDEGPRREWRANPLASGGYLTLTVDLPPGTYEVDCPIESAHGEHDALGMEMLLRVHDGALPAEAASEQPEPDGTSGADGRHAVHVAAFAYGPEEVHVPLDRSVTWVNEDDAPHTATGDGWDTGVLTTGEAGTVRFDRAGRHEYRCELHPTMTGTVIVDGP